MDPTRPAAQPRAVLRRLSLEALSRWVVSPGAALNRKRLAVVLCGAYLLFGTTYLSVNVYSIGRPAHRLWLPGEERIPFVPEFEFLYLLGYVLPIVVVFRLPDLRRFRQLAIAFALTLAVAYATYLVFPVYLERPILVVNSPATWLLWLEYHDPSYNHFPSLHIAISWLMYFACRERLRRPAVMLALLLGLSVSTLFVKQHYFVDVVYGVALAAGAWRVAAGAATRSLDGAPGAHA